ncbi:MAG: hypothetical protein ACLR5M_09435 [Bifidobacterium longum]
MNEIVQAISTVGFPIVACGAMFYFYDRTIKDLTVTLTKIDTTLDGIAKKLDHIEEFEKKLPE